MKNMLMVPLLALALSAAAADKPAKPASMGPATMCNTSYALCIKAPCDASKESGGYVPCECVMQTGWNMGPNSCDERKKTLTSTYSNNFNKGSSTVTCSSTSTPWAWCYGATCETDASAPYGLRVTCKCPLKKSKTVILVSDAMCADPGKVCGKLWSAAFPAESNFANNHYWDWMKANGHATQTYPPAKACSTTSSK